jgi:hypothetical protein
MHCIKKKDVITIFKFWILECHIDHCEITKLTLIERYFWFLKSKISISP